MRVFFKYIFRFGPSEPVKSWLPEGKFNVSLKDFMDYALMVAGSSFTVGVAEEERDTASLTEMADAPERTHKMVATATGHIITAIHESGKVTAYHCESNQVTVDHHESSQVMDNLRESNQDTAVIRSLFTSQLICQSLVTSRLVFQSLVTSQLFTQSLVTSQLVYQSHFTSQLIIQSHFTSQLIIQCHFTSQLICQSHFTSQLIFQSHFMPQLIFQSHFRYSRSLLRVPSLVSSVRDAPLVSAHAAGIPKPTHTNHLAPELIAPSTALPMWGVALWCIWVYRGGAGYNLSRGGGLCCGTFRGSSAHCWAPRGHGAVSSEVAPRYNFPELSVLAKEFWNYICISTTQTA